MAKKQIYEKTDNGLMKRLNSTLFSNIVLSLIPAQKLGRAKVFVNFWVELKSFAKYLSRAKVQNVLKSILNLLIAQMSRVWSFNSTFGSSIVFS